MEYQRECQEPSSSFVTALTRPGMVVHQIGVCLHIEDSSSRLKSLRQVIKETGADRANAAGTPPIEGHKTQDSSGLDSANAACAPPQEGCAMQDSSGSLLLITLGWNVN
jgi:hypothetical protein